MFQEKRRSYGSSLRDGAKVVGWAFLAFSILCLIFTLLTWFLLEAQLTASEGDVPPKGEDSPPVLMVLYFSVWSVFSLMLLVGAYRDRRARMIFTSVNVVFCVLAVHYRVTSNVYVMRGLELGVLLMIFYFISNACSLCKKQKDDEFISDEEEDDI